MTSQSIKLPISSSGMKPRGICKESGNDAPQNWIWITYTNREMDEMRPHPPYAPCCEAHPRLPWATLKPSPERVQPHDSQCQMPALAP